MKTNLLFKLMLLAGALFAAGCDNGGDSAGEVAYTLSGSKNSVKIGEEVTFTVTAGKGEDVTAEWNFYEGETMFDGNKASWDKAGSYTVTARSKTDPAVSARNSVIVTVTDAAEGVTYTLFSLIRIYLKINMKFS